MSKGAVIGGDAAGAAIGAGLAVLEVPQSREAARLCGRRSRRFGHRKGQPDLQAREQAKPVVEDRQRVELLGKKAKDSASEPTFEVRKLSKDVGQCTSTNAAEVMAPN